MKRGKDILGRKGKYGRKEGRRVGYGRKVGCGRIWNRGMPFEIEKSKEPSSETCGPSLSHTFVSFFLFRSCFLPKPSS
jgi:hypothetical protein